jgi:hypothetical protein
MVPKSTLASDRFIALRLAHDLGQDETRSSDKRAGNNQHGVVDHETGGRCSETGVGVQQGYDDRHICATDRQRQHDAENACDTDQHPEEHGV